MDNKTGHKHGSNPQSDLLRFGLTSKPLLDFSVNLNPLGPPEIIKEQWLDLFKAVEVYPSVEGEGISDFYQHRFDLPYENILAGNGSTEMIYLVPRVLGIKNALIFTPCFHDYARASLMVGAKLTAYPLNKENTFGFPEPDQIAEMIRHVDALWIGRPNNPTGTLISKDIILGLAKRFPEKWFIIDEAFIQFVDAWEQKTLLNEGLSPNILVLHSLTKFYAIAGLRMGAAVGAGDVIARLKKAKEPWTVNGIADKVAPLLLDCKDYEAQTLELVSQERKRVYQRLQELEGIHVFPGTANYMLCQWSRTENLDDLLRHLLSNSVYIRDCRNFPGLEDQFFRFGLRSSEDNNRLLHLLEEAI